MSKSRAQEEVLTAEDDLYSMAQEQNESFDPYGDEDLPEQPEEPVYDFDFSHTNQVEDGEYHAKCQSFVRGTTKNGKPEFQLKVYLPQIGRSLNANMSLVEGALNMTGDALRAIGVGPQDGSKGMFSFRPSEVVGKIFRVKIVNEEYQGQVNPKIKRWLPANEETIRLFSEI